MLSTRAGPLCFSTSFRVTERRPRSTKTCAGIYRITTEAMPIKLIRLTFASKVAGAS